MSRVVWITGLPASGKTSVAQALITLLESRGFGAALVDSDLTRAVLTPNPTYAPAERALVYRAMAYLARRLDETGAVAIVAATAHTRALRDEMRAITGGLFLVYASTSLATCEARDPKGLYARARKHPEGAMPGVHVTYETPDDADLDVDAGEESAGAAALRVLEALERAGILARA